MSAARGVSRPGFAGRATPMLRVPGLVALALALLLAGCATPPPTSTTGPAPRVSQAPVVSYESAAWSELPGWQADTFTAAWPAFLASCKVMRAKPQWSEPCAQAEGLPTPSNTAIREFFTRAFKPWRIVRDDASGRSAQGLITGYFEPLLQGARRPSTRYVAPLYSPPPDLLTVDLSSLYPELAGKRVRGRLQGNTVLPYWTRAQLPTDPALKGHEIVWIDNALDAFLLEVQGSGRVQLPDGSQIRLQYADQNGQPYRAIGRYLVSQGALTVDQATLPGIRAWLAANPQRLQEVLNANPSVVFFNEAPLGDPNTGPRGSQGVALTPERSIAVDPAYVPLGTPVFLSTTLPGAATGTSASPGQPLQRLVVAQDTGGAISGAPRADFFCGTGPQAAALAGQMRQQGTLWLLWPKDAPLPAR